MMCWAIMQTSLRHPEQGLQCTFLMTLMASVPLPRLGAFRACVNTKRAGIFF